MRRSIALLTSVTLLTGIVGLGGYQVQAQTHPAITVRASATPQTTSVLVWQGKLLPIVTDVFGSINEFNTALQAHNVRGISKVGDKFAGELQRFQMISPTPPQAKKISLTFTTALRDMADGTKALVAGLQNNSSANAQRAGDRVLKGLREFQTAVNQVRRSSGPPGEPTVVPPANAGPVATPIIRGLP
ncbi:MAG: hypothetical protein JWO59_3263 [Chloroflexi bacterium]|nr:hypothetical protein [Chloroflexota bacterium]